MMRCALLVGSIPAGGELVVSPHESALLGPRSVPKRREDFVRGRWLAKQLLAAARPGSRPADYVILPDPMGAPVVHDATLNPLPVSLSISHTQGLAAAALCDSPSRAGVDIERPIEKPESIVGEYFTGEELRLCAGLSGAALQTRAALIWSVKETLMKVLGQGLRIAPTSVGLAGIGAREGEWWSAAVFLRGPDVESASTPRVWVKEGVDHVMSLAMLGSAVRDEEAPRVELFGVPSSGRAG